MATLDGIYVGFMVFIESIITHILIKQVHKFAFSYKLQAAKLKIGYKVTKELLNNKCDVPSLLIKMAE